MKKINLIIAVLIVALIGINVSAEICECNSCKDCIEKLSEDSCSEIRLNKDIDIHSQEEGIISYGTFSCIESLEFNNKIFDCQGHKIKGNAMFYNDNDKEVYINKPATIRDGIILFNNFNSTIKNCIFLEFSSGISIAVNTSNNKIVNNTLYINSYEISIGSFSSNNIIINNTIYKNREGIEIVRSTNNTLTNNILHSNTNGIMTYINANFNKIFNNKIYDNTENGIWMSLLGGCFGKGCTHQGSTGNELSNNEITGNDVGINSESSNFTANSNFVCGNNKDFELVYSVVGEGNDNVCDNPNTWNDKGKKGCTHKCNEQKTPDKQTESDYNFILAIAIILITILLSAFVIWYKKFKR
ncbi:MAG: right-handed parallel beta-helix repeat-containing protein [Candidatus Altarchaeum sp.]|nr:right-handed parallel beta-helix repeat-containing protein [Candidatus Altarchaeum sp.]